ncbi:MAG: hypothetical protein J6333_00300 [Planctomycetes bacterium]|nr:hypothetical protein [Planctomycetota bacterium]
MEIAGSGAWDERKRLRFRRPCTDNKGFRKISGKSAIDMLYVKIVDCVHAHFKNAPNDQGP